MAGFTLGNDLLIITGSLVGASGAFLSNIMCKGMNRKFISVILGGFGGDAPKSGGGEAKDYGDYTETSADEVAAMLKDAKRVVVSPGYGMAVAQAQFPVADLTRKLIDAGVDVSFGIHPVAGRMPGHMNVLLAEAKVPYENVFEMDEINDEFEDVDVVLVIGANDTVNPAAETEPDSPIAGMPSCACGTRARSSSSNAAWATRGTPACRTRCSSMTTPTCCWVTPRIPWRPSSQRCNAHAHGLL